jgi:histidinol dehydrogenase
MIVAEPGAQPAWIAADLLAQAEHDVAERAVLVTTSEALAAAVERELARQLVDLPRADIARAALVAHGAAVVTATLDDAIDLVNRYAPEHVELHLASPQPVADRIRTAGAIFVGAFTPEAAGDYLAGPNHVLPTAGAARFASPLGVYDFRRRTSIIEYGRDGLVRHVADISRLARVEGLDAHARSAAARLQPPDDGGDDGGRPGGGLLQ